MLTAAVQRSPLERAQIVQYRPAIDGLRAVAVIAVFLFHLNRQWLPGGFVGVDVFFVISGYLITSIIRKDCEAESFSFAKFYQRRIARLVPASFLVLFATLAAATFVYLAQDLASCGANLAAAALSIINIKYLFQGSYFALSPDAQPVLHYWSLAVEEQFYLFFPALFLLLFRKAGAYRQRILIGLCIGSFVLCFAVTRVKPEWAFYLLPTRAWELLAGGILASSESDDRKSFPAWLPAVGLLLVLASLVFVKEGPNFPGLLAVFPVLGTTLILGGGRGRAESLLSASPMVFIGKMSYSLYLWHWPIFSLVDYRYFAASSALRLTLKIVLTALCCGAGFFLVERPGREFFNRKSNRRWAFALLLACVTAGVLVGNFVRRYNYLDATGTVAKGGLILNPQGRKGTLMLMGDSQGSMYGTAMREAALKTGMRLIITSEAGVDALPAVGSEPQVLWEDSLHIVRKQHPTVIVLACKWGLALSRNRERARLAVAQLEDSAGRIILLSQPPELPREATRAGIRGGNRSPFFEDPRERSQRVAANAFISQLASGKVSVLDIENLFTDSGGAVRLTDSQGNQLFQDAEHLSNFGADLVVKRIAAPL